MDQAYRLLFDSRPLEFHVAFIANIEATFTPLMKLIIDNRESLFAEGDTRVASLFIWHFVEEIEHRSSALIIYDEVVGRPWYRVRQVPAVHRVGREIGNIVEGDFRKFVPELENRDGMGEMAVSDLFRMKPVRTAAWRIFLSQTPFHSPLHEPLPAFALEWLDREAEGEDMSRIYGVGAQLGRREPSSSG